MTFGHVDLEEGARALALFLAKIRLIPEPKVVNSLVNSFVTKLGIPKIPIKSNLDFAEVVICSLASSILKLILIFIVGKT